MADKLVLLLCGGLLLSRVAGAAPPHIMSADALDAFPSPPADATIAYGADPLQFGELRLPPGDGPFPAIVLIHGGCWLAKYDLSYIRKLAAAFTAAGIATWTVEYRRVGDPGGGWPGTYEDIAASGDHLRSLAGQY
ncbi:MAG: alpha/beta hydrolase, partial [Gammaproteobacteria bacterium]|nr:alpha/beta hydrolase [Gammaproteobacteria bacterium]